MDCGDWSFGDNISGIAAIICAISATKLLLVKDCTDLQLIIHKLDTGVHGKLTCYHKKLPPSFTLSNVIAQRLIISPESMLRY